MNQGQERKGKFPCSSGSTKGRVPRNSLAPSEMTCIQAAEAKGRLEDWWDKAKEGIRNHCHSYTGSYGTWKHLSFFSQVPLSNSKALQVLNVTAAMITGG